MGVARWIVTAALALITMMVVTVGGMMLDRNVPIEDPQWRFVAWNEEGDAVVEFTGNRVRSCDGVTQAAILNGEGVSMRLFWFAPQETAPTSTRPVGEFQWALNYAIPVGIDPTKPVLLTFWAEYFCNPLHRLWPLRVDWPPLRLPMETRPAQSSLRNAP